MPHPSDLSPFAEAGPALIARGYSALPIAPGDKAPGAFIGGEWRMMRGWSKFCGVLPPAFQVKTWTAWPNAGVGVACGNGLVLVDIDLEEAVGHVMAALPPTFVAKKGAKGLTLAFRGNTAKIRSRAFKIDKVGAVDLLSDGKQSVLPPSIHPRTGRPYVWMTERTLLDTPLAELPEVPDNVADLIAEALKPLGYAPEATFEFGGEIKESVSQSTDFFRRLNEDALANLDAWVPKLNLYRSIRQSGGGWRAVPHWRPSSKGNSPQKRALNLSFDPRGIKDFGDGDKTYTPLNVVMAACDLGDDLDTAAKWLGEWIGYDFGGIIDIVAGPSSPSERAKAARAAAAALPAPVVPAAVLAASEPAPEAVSPPRPTPAVPLGNIAAALAGLPYEPEAAIPSATVDRKLERYRRLEELSHAPGLVGQMVDWITESAPKPSRVLALGAALAAIGTMSGRHYKTPTNLRTNVYIINLAGSTYGKDHARKCLNYLFERHGMGKHVGGSKIMSGSALRKQMEQQPATLYMLDEYAGMMRDISDRRSGPHVMMIRDFMLEYYGSSAGVFRGADYAGEKGQVQYAPNLCIYATSTPEDFWASVGSKLVTDGFLGRNIIMTVDGPRPRTSEPKREIEDIPRSIIDTFHKIMEQRGGNLSGMTNDGSTEVATLAIGFAPATKKMIFTRIAEIEDESDLGPPEFSSIYGRIAENAQKLACILAVGVDPDAPFLTPEMLDWGFEVARISAESAMDEMRTRLADSDFQRQYQEVKRFVADAGSVGLSRTALTKRINGKFAPRVFEDIMKMLDESGDVKIQMTQNPRGGPLAARYVYLGQEQAMLRLG
ncbi:hypothetical protein PMNALOAF_2714 [Methylobacterium adhaesivum]|uniref:Bifunctional DNA primase/polymerase n=1 Tax=Methylobacterium adhaesivum TaxID=333297 RepID=A0ABT8BIS6_9HYPH|nr:bifunctional DNA primase/polymerase [Methylobacterium adhaesivum]MDN3592068.1 bifunctional DNA primase/polymerase [Methylobacterium adhaesivum]GJD31455.1 hypothetical protein PMNALOAF_2714 [Methylobacterium adhaesivum]